MSRSRSSGTIAASRPRRPGAAPSRPAPDSASQRSISARARVSGSPLSSASSSASRPSCAARSSSPSAPRRPAPGGASAASAGRPRAQRLQRRLQQLRCVGAAAPRRPPSRSHRSRGPLSRAPSASSIERAMRAAEEKVSREDSTSPPRHSASPSASSSSSRSFGSSRPEASRAAEGLGVVLDRLLEGERPEGTGARADAVLERLGGGGRTGAGVVTRQLGDVPRVVAVLALEDLRQAAVKRRPAARAGRRRRPSDGRARGRRRSGRACRARPPSRPAATAASSAAITSSPGISETSVTSSESNSLPITEATSSTCAAPSPSSPTRWSIASRTRSGTPLA